MSLVGDGVIRDVPEIRDLSFSAVIRETLFHLVVYGSFAGAVAENIMAESSTGRRTNERDLALYYWFSRIGSVAWKCQPIATFLQPGATAFARFGPAMATISDTARDYAYFSVPHAKAV